MNDTVYEIVFQSNMITKLDEIYDYILECFLLRLL